GVPRPAAAPAGASTASLSVPAAYWLVASSAANSASRVASGRPRAATSANASPAATTVTAGAACNSAGCVAGCQGPRRLAVAGALVGHLRVPGPPTAGRPPGVEAPRAGQEGY